MVLRVYNRSMSEILERLPQKNDEKSVDNVADWDILTEKKQEADWDSVKEVEFQEGATKKLGIDEAEAEAEEVADKVAKLKSWIDLESIARDEDPEGLAVAEQEGEVRRLNVEQRKAELADNAQRMVELERRKEELPKEMSKAYAAQRQERGFLSGVKRTLGIGAARRAEILAKVAALEEESTGLGERRGELENERQSLEKTIAMADVEEPKREFVEKFETPLTPEEKKEGLDFEALAELTTDEYLRLWRRLNPFFVTHVTRQGVRDHNAMFYHSAGMGEFHDGMTEILADGKMLRTPAEVHYGLGREVTEQSTEKALEKMLYKETSQTDIEEMREQGMGDREIVESLVERLPVNRTIASAEPWTDKRAVHLAQSLVLDDYYGGESGNETFFVFPTDVIASQCQFGGSIRNNLTTAQVGSEVRWNDMFVWPKEKDITIDAGLAFLPKSTMVDAETGSKYATKVVKIGGKEVRIPEVDEEAIAKFVEWMEGLKPEDEGVRMATSDENRYDMSKLREAGREAGVSERILEDVLDVASGFPYDLQKFVDGDELRTLRNVPQDELAQMTPEERRRLSVRNLLGESATWKLAENAVPAEEYWEKYFAEHPEQRPAHVIYYDGEPNEAVVSTLEGAGILEKATKPYGLEAYDEWQRYTGKNDSHERDGGWLGFEENLVRDAATDENLQASHKRFNELAKKKIAEHYGLKI